MNNTGIYLVGEVKESSESSLRNLDRLVFLNDLQELMKEHGVVKVDVAIDIHAYIRTNDIK